MTEPVSLAQRRWNNGDTLPQAHSPRDVLEVALAKLDAGELVADHIVICFGESNERKNHTHFMQAGKFDSFSQIGLLSHAMRIMMKGAE